MKVAVMMLALVAFHVEGMSVLNDAPRCPPVDPMDHTIHLPHPEDCSLFYRCNHGVGLVEKCPGGLHFNPELQVCDWPHNANCQVGVTEAPATTEEQTEPPTEEQTEPPTEEQTEPPTEAPTDEPSEEVTDPPTEAPTEEPSEEITDPPTEAPTEEETDAPTEAPTEEPSEEITDPPTEAPTEEETDPPTEAPTEEPSEEITEPPTDAPTEEPSEEITEAPTEEETDAPTEEPTTVRPTSPPLPTTCPPWHFPNEYPHVLLPHETRCHFYYKCVYGKKVLQICEIKQNFSPKKRKCVPFYLAGCKHQNDNKYTRH